MFDLPDRLFRKADPALIARDEQHFAAIAECLEQLSADLSDRLDAARKLPGGIGQRALDSAGGRLLVDWRSPGHRGPQRHDH